jgi:hypothetical protein
MPKRRWTDDERGQGVASASRFAPGIEELLAASKSPDWVAEEPELHLLPHMQAALEGLSLGLVSTRVHHDGVFEVELRWTGGQVGQGAIRAGIFELIGSFAESATSVRQRGSGTSLVFEVVTGLLEGDSEFVSHGHTVRFLIKE